MKKGNPEIFIGTSGWSYTHWKEIFYPHGLSTTEWLHFYAEAFPTVEVNTTFYHTPSLSTVENWFKQVPKDFRFSIKASGYITHQKRLHDCEESLGYFFESIKKLKSKVGPILFQLPPSFKINQERLMNFISHLDKKYQYTFEFRHISWFTKEIYDLLTKHQIALCITDLNGKLTPEEITSYFSYIRLHGPHSSYQGSYGTPKLKIWKKKIEKWLSSNTSVYCYFDNDEKGYAIQDAKQLQNLLRE
mgnify:CR=1 FL=1